MPFYVSINSARWGWQTLANETSHYWRNTLNFFIQLILPFPVNSNEMSAILDPPFWFFVFLERIKKYFSTWVCYVVLWSSPSIFFNNRENCSNRFQDVSIFMSNKIRYFQGQQYILFVCVTADVNLQSVFCYKVTLSLNKKFLNKMYTCASLKFVERLYYHCLISIKICKLKF